VQGGQGGQEKIKIKRLRSSVGASTGEVKVKVKKQLGTGANWYLVFCNAWFIMIMCFEYRNFMEAVCVENR